MFPEYLEDAITDHREEWWKEQARLRLAISRYRDEAIEECAALTDRWAKSGDGSARFLELLAKDFRKLKATK